MNLKQTLLAAAVAAVVAAPAASYASATLYGRLALSGQHISKLTNNGKSESNFGSGVWSPSYIGLKGSAPGNNGLSTFFNVRLAYNAIGSTTSGKSGNTTSYGVNSSNQANNFYTRLAYLGVKGSFGTVLAGRVYDPFYTFVNKPVDPTLQVNSGMGPVGMGYQYFVNAVAYVSPSYQGFTGIVAAGNLGTDNNKSTRSILFGDRIKGSNQAVYELAGQYKWNRLTVSGAAMYLPKHATEQRVIATPSNGSTGTGIGIGLANAIRSLYGIAASYNLGLFTVAGNFEHSNANHIYFGKLASVNSWGLTAHTQMGALSGYVLYSGSKSAISSSKTAARIAAGVFYNLSKPMQVGFEIAHNNRTATAVDGVAANPAVNPIGFTNQTGSPYSNSNYKSSNVYSIDMTYRF